MRGCGVAPERELAKSLSLIYLSGLEETWHDRDGSTRSLGEQRSSTEDNIEEGRGLPSQRPDDILFLVVWSFRRVAPAGFSLVAGRRPVPRFRGTYQGACFKIHVAHRHEEALPEF